MHELRRGGVQQSGRVRVNTRDLEGHGTDPVAIATLSAVTERWSSPAATASCRVPVSVASPMITTADSWPSTICRFTALSLEIRASRRCCAWSKYAYGSLPRRCVASCKRVFVGTQPMLMQVPPTIASARSISATEVPCDADFAAMVLPASPQPTTTTSTCSSEVLTR